MKKQLIFFIILVSNIVILNAQQCDIYLITKRYVGYTESCSENKQIKWLPEFEDNKYKVYVFSDKILVEETSNHTALVKTDSLGYFKQEQDGGSITEYYGTCDEAVCTIGFYLNEHKSFKLILFYKDWSLGYELKLIKN